MISAALVFPGQGSQLVGMGKQLAMAYPAARLVFEEVDEALNQSLSRIMFEGNCISCISSLMWSKSWKALFCLD